MIKELYDLENRPDDYFILPPRNTNATNAFEQYVQDLNDETFFIQDTNPNNRLLTEVLFREQICNHLQYQVEQVSPNWQQAKRQFTTSCAKIPFDDFPAEFKKYEDKLKTIAKLKFCIDLLKSSKNTESLDLDTANYLFVIYHKLAKQHTRSKSENSTRVTNDENYNSQIYTYLSNASIETGNLTNIDKLSNWSINQVVSEMFNHIILEQWKYAYFIFSQPQSTGYNERKIIPMFSETLCETVDAALNLAEHKFNKWLIEQMHTLDNNRTF